MKKIGLSIFIILYSFFGFSQETFMVNGPHHKNHNYYAFTHATIYVDYATKIENATLLIQDGRVVLVGKKVQLPTGVVIYDLKGKYIYPSLIDLYSNYGLPQVVSKKKERRGPPQLESNKKGAQTIDQIHMHD